MKLLEPFDLGPRRAPNRMLFGPHETNLGQGRKLSDHHVAYYRERALGGVGTIVIEEASVHPSDWPYERCPDAAVATEGWAAVADACRGPGALILAGLGHSGGQGSSAYSQRELWAPSDEPEVNSREVPKVMEIEDIAAVVDGFRLAARSAAEADLDGVEVNAGQHSLIRQFLSGLTNRRDDRYGQDRLLFAREVLGAVRAGVGDDRVLGLRLSCDELAPWAGITPESAATIAVELAGEVDYLVVVRGAIFSVAETRPTGHHGEGFNLDLAASIRAAVGGAVPIFAQGSIVDPDQADWAIGEGRCDGVEMTRAQIADPELVAKLLTGRRPRPCVLCNQACKVRDNRNPIVGCISEPRAGHELSEPAPPVTGGGEPDRLLVVGAGPAGLEAARTAASHGREVTVIDSSPEAGGLLRTIARSPGHHRFGLLAEWLVAAAVEQGVELRLGETASPELIDGWDGPVVIATGGRRSSITDVDPDDEPLVQIDDRATVIAAEDVIDADEDAFERLVPSTVAVWDPVGNAVAVAVSELLASRGRAVTFITPDPIAGTLLSLTGDLAGANVRLQQAGVAIERRRRLRAVGPASVTVEHVFTAAVDELPTEAVIDCSPRTADEDLWRRTGASLPRVGDSVAARTVADAIREGRAAAMALSDEPAVSGRVMSP